ncbi:tetratricopeptide repeat protein [Ferruginibacter albus]|uniref:tetratricopeptide repeat protein n=1 Tax=Ferruginibacter albus TaxID=2875540 RepID=UPI001CC3B2BE|nr:CDC27 family protein [Ferruginibacter albus]UAY52193.1 hypothetical protein K9M53_00525 [Ferruginibacter albus]
MKKFISVVLVVMITTAGFTQENVGQLHENARKFMSQGDYSNAALILNKAHTLSPNDLEVTKDLALSYLFQSNNNKALETITPTLEREDADDQCYQIAGSVYQALGRADECEKLYKKAVKKFPSSGGLYNDYGELLWNRQDYSGATTQWENGINADPSYSKNYYNACRNYYLSGDNVWAILCGEIFLNMDPASSKTPEIKNILLESYKLVFTNISSLLNKKDNSKFTAVFLEALNKQSDLAANGITPETLTMIRTRFILDWYQNDATKYPFRLFDLQKQLLQTGMFDAYNQWIFGTAQNLSAYQNWTIAHTAEYNEFNYFQRGRIFKIPKGQYYK